MHLIELKIELLADLFLGAAYSDKEFCDDERFYVRRLLADLLCVDQVPDYLEKRIEQFDIIKFDLQAAAKEFAAQPPMSKRRLLELIAQVINANGVLDLAEDDYVHELAGALNVPIEDYHDLVLDYEIEQLRESFHEIVGLPPPIPEQLVRKNST